MEEVNTSLQSSSLRQRSFRFRNIAILSVVSLVVVVATILITLAVDRAINPSVENNTSQASREDSGEVVQSDEEVETIFDENDLWFQNLPYPAEVANLLVKDTYKFECGLTYTGYEGLDGKKFYSSTDTNGQSVTLQEQRFLMALTAVENLIGQSIYMTSECSYVNDDEETEYVYLYSYCSEVGRCGGAIGSTVGIAYYENDTLAYLETLNKLDAGYPRCTDLLAVTKDMRFYVNCQAGEVLYKVQDIYVFDIEAGKIEMLGRVDNADDLPTQ